MTHYDGSLMAALIDSFPDELKELKEEIGEQERRRRGKRSRSPTGHWSDIENRRRFFIDFAAEAGFDPADADAWNGITVARIHAKVSRDPFC